MKKLLLFIFSLFLILIAVPLGQVKAQTEGPVYIVQPGDTLNSIAERFGIGINDLLEWMPGRPQPISAGTQSRIPSLSGYPGY